MKVNSGVAFDNKGRRIVLPDNYPAINLANEPSGQTVYITIAYDEKPTDDTKETGISGDTRWTELPLVEKSLTLPANPNEKLVLAAIERSGTTIKAIDRTLRRVAGAKNSLTLTSEAIDSTGWVTMNLGAAKRADLVGDLRVTGNLTVEGETTVASTERMQGNVILGDADGDITTVEGSILTGHSSGRLKIGSPTDIVGNLALADTAGQTATRLQSYSNANSLWMLQPTTQRLVLADGVDWDRGVALQYTPGTTGTAGGAMLIGQLLKNSPTFTHGYTALFTNGAERMRIDSSGNVGIGTATPGALLEVNKSQNVPTTLNVLNSGTGTNSVAYVLVGSAAVNGTYGYLGYFGSSCAPNGIFQATRTVLSGQDTGGLHLAATHASGAMTFTTGGYAIGNERMRIDAAGNVGIGTTNTAAYKLQVAGPTLAEGAGLYLAASAGQTPTRLYSYSNANSLWMLQPTTQTLVLGDAVDWDRGVALQYTAGTTGAAAGGMLIGQLLRNSPTFTHGYTALYTNGAERVRVNSAGNVGIGTASPAKPLDVAGSGGIRISQTGAANSTNEILFQDNGQIRSLDDNHRIIFDRANNIIELREYGDLIFSPGATATARTQTVTFKSGGNVGIGTANPTYKLDVAGTLHATGAVKFDGTFGYGDSSARTEFRDNAGLQGNAGAQSGFFQTAAPTNYPSGATSWWHLLDVRHTNPANNHALQIAGSFYDQDLYFRKTNNSATTAWNKFIYADSAGKVNVLVGSNQISFTNAWSNTPDLVTNGAEISNDAGSYKTLMIVGNRANGGPRRVSVWDRLEVNGDLHVTGSPTKQGGAATWTVLSDKTLKKDITPIDGALEKILQLRGVSFAWREPEQHNATDGRYMGMVAQEVEKVFPEWVRTVPSGHKGIDLIGFEALVIEAFRQLSTRCERLEAELVELRGGAAKPKAAARKKN